MGAQVAIVTDQSIQNASLGNNVAITQAGDGQVNAQSNRTLTEEVVSGVIGGGVAAGAAIGQASAGGSTSAQVGKGVNIGQFAIQHVASLTVSAIDHTTAFVQGYAVAAAILGSGAGDSSTTTVNPSVPAGVGSNGAITLTCGIGLETESNETATSNTYGVSAGGGVAIPVAPADATLSPSLATTIGGNTTLGAGGSITFQFCSSAVVLC